MSQELSKTQLMVKVAELEKTVEKLNASMASLADSEDLHRTTLENISETVIITDDNGHFTYVSPNIHIIFGLDQHAVHALGSIENLLEKEVFSKDGLKQKREISNIKYQLIDADDNTHFLLINVKQVNIKGGTILYVIRDATAINTTERSLEDSEQKYHNLVNNLPGTAYQFFVDPRGEYQFEYIGEKCRDLFGYSPTEILKDPAKLFNTIPQPDLDKVIARINHSMESLTPYKIDHRVVAEDGKTKWVHASSIPRKKADGGILWDGIGLDITDRKQKEIELTGYKNIVSSTSDLISFVDTDYVYRIVNDAYFRLNTTKNQDIVGQTVPEIVGDEAFTTIIKKELDRCFAGETVKFQAWFDFLSFGRRYMAVTYSPHYEDGTVRGAIVNVKDITDIAKFEQELQAANRELTLRGRIAELFLTSPKDDVYSDIFDCLLDAFDSTYGCLGYIDEKGNLVCPSVTRTIWGKCNMKEKGVVFPKDCWGRVWGESLVQKQSYLNNREGVTPVGHISLKNVLATPILFQDKLIGQIVLADKETGFTSDDQDRLEAISGFLAPILQIRIDKEKARDELQKYAEKLENKNVALSVLLDNREEEKSRLTNDILDNFERLVLPYFDDLKKCRYLKEMVPLMEIIEQNLHECISTVEKSFSTPYRDFTPSESKVANLVKLGKSSKDVAEILKMSTRAVYFHRNNIRKKLNIRDKKDNLQTFLAALK